MLLQEGEMMQEFFKTLGYVFAWVVFLTLLVFLIIAFFSVLMPMFLICVFVC